MCSLFNAVNPNQHNNKNLTESESTMSLENHQCALKNKHMWGHWNLLARRRGKPPAWKQPLYQHFWINDFPPLQPTCAWGNQESPKLSFSYYNVGMVETWTAAWNTGWQSHYSIHVNSAQDEITVVTHQPPRANFLSPRNLGGNYPCLLCCLLGVIFHYACDASVAMGQADFEWSPTVVAQQIGRLGYALLTPSSARLKFLLLLHCHSSVVFPRFIFSTYSLFLVPPLPGEFCFSLGFNLDATSFKKPPCFGSRASDMNSVTFTSLSHPK